MADTPSKQNKNVNKISIGKWLKFLGLDAAAKLGLTGLSQLPMALVGKYGKEDASAVSKLMSLGKSKGVLSHEDILPFTAGRNAFFQPLLKSISASKDLENKAGVIGHELGHALNAASTNKIVKGISNLRLAQPLQFAPSAAGLINGAFFRNLTTKQMLGVDAIGTAAYSPWLLEELSASLRGYNAARNAGAGRLASAAAFAGLPSYIANAAAPWLQTLMQHKLGLTKNTMDK